MNETLHESTGGDDQAMARAAPDQARTTTLDNTEDRRVHGWATMGFGALIAAFSALNQWGNESSVRSGLPILLAYVLLQMGLAAWQSATARTWPAGSMRLSWIGVGTSAIVAFVGNMALNWLGQSGPVAPTLIVLFAVIATLPSILAGARIMRGRR